MRSVVIVDLRTVARSAAALVRGEGRLDEHLAITYAGTMTLDISGSYANYTVFHLFSNFDPASVTGNLDGITVSGSGDFSALTFAYDGDQGIWVSGTTTGGQFLTFDTISGDLVVVPEPSTLLMAAAACGTVGLLWGKRKREKALADASSRALTTTPA